MRPRKTPTPPRAVNPRGDRRRPCFWSRRTLTGAFAISALLALWAASPAQGQEDRWAVRAHGVFYSPTGDEGVF